MHRMARRQKNVATADVRRGTDKKLGEIAKKHRKSKRQFIIESLDWVAIKDALIERHFPKLSKVGETDDGAVVIKDEDFPNNLVEVRMKDNLLYCNREKEDQMTQCRHVFFVLALPTVDPMASAWQKYIPFLDEMIKKSRKQDSL